MKSFIKRKKPFLIAEIGINHNGSVELAKKLIYLAKSCNFNVVKFQKRNLDVCIPEVQKNIVRETPWGKITYINYKKKIEFGKKEFQAISNYCKKLKINWFCSAFDISSLNFLKQFKLKYNKVASAVLTNIPLITEIAKEKKLTFISTGMSEIKDIVKAVKIFKKLKCKFILMHCVSTYPAEEKDLNLNTIKTLKNKFKCEVGYSGHESSVSPSIAAWFLGADYIETHITLDRSMWGTDQAASLSREGMNHLSSVLLKMPILFGDGKKRILVSEKKLISKFKYW